MNQQKGLKIGNVPTDKLVIMVDVSRQELNKLLKRLRDHKDDVPSLDELEKQVNLWKNRYAISSAELRRRVNEKFNTIQSKPSVREQK